MRYLMALSALLVVLFGALYAVRWYEVRDIKSLAENALCVLELEEGNPSASVSFTTAQTVDHFEVGVWPKANPERLSLVFDGGDSFHYTGVITKPGRFGVGSKIPPGTYTVALSQETGSHGGIVAIAEEAPVSTGMNGWQILSRSYLGLLAICGVWALSKRRSSNQWQRAISIFVLQSAFLVFVVIFLYLLFHEGGHSLGEIAFGRFDIARTDFWGIHGVPHSGGISGPALKPWQQGIITGGGLMMPTFAGWALFLLWMLWIRRNRHLIVRLYFSATTVVFIVPYVISAGASLLRVMGDGHFDGFMSCLFGPQWLREGIAWAILLVCVLILWQLVPEIIRIFKAESSRLERIKQSHQANEASRG